MAAQTGGSVTLTGTDKPVQLRGSIVEGHIQVQSVRRLRQNKSFAPNWKTRGKFVEPLQAPKVALPTLVSTGFAPVPTLLGGAKKCQFQMLNASARNWKVYFSVIRIFFLRAKSWFRSGKTLRLVMRVPLPW